MYVEYNSNNSGGNWWLDDEDWLALEAAGWELDRFADRDDGYEYGDRFMDAICSKATRRNVSMAMAIDEWERITGQTSAALGCNCCGPPHGFTSYDDDDEVIDDYYPHATEGARYEE